MRQHATDFALFFLLISAFLRPLRQKESSQWQVKGHASYWTTGKLCGQKNQGKRNKQLYHNMLLFSYYTTRGSAGD